MTMFSKKNRFTICFSLYYDWCVVPVTVTVTEMLHFSIKASGRKCKDWNIDVNLDNRWR
jgi:hypothetical protein